MLFRDQKEKKTKTARPDISLNTEKKEKLVLFLEEKLFDCEETRDDLKEVLQNAAMHVFEKKKKKNADWFDDQDDAIQAVLKDKKLCGDKSELKKEIRKLKNGWFQQRHVWQNYMEEKKTIENSTQFSMLLMGPNLNLHPVRSKTGALLSSAEDIKKRWVEHFNELLNQLTNDDWDILGGIKIHPTLKELDAPIITMAEVGTAFKNTRAR